MLILSPHALEIRGKTLLPQIFLVKTSALGPGTTLRAALSAGASSFDFEALGTNLLRRVALILIL